MMCSIACLRRATLQYACTLILHMHTSTASFITQPDVVQCSITCLRSWRMRTSAAHTPLEAHYTARAWRPAPKDYS